MSQIVGRKNKHVVKILFRHTFESIRFGSDEAGTGRVGAAPDSRFGRTVNVPVRSHTTIHIYQRFSVRYVFAGRHDAYARHSHSDRYWSDDGRRPVC